MRPGRRIAIRKEDPMLRAIPFVIALFLALAATDAPAQAKKGAAASVKPPSEKEPSIAVIVYMRDAAKNELLVGTHIWPGNLDYTMVALQRYFALLKALEPAYKQDDEVAYTWAQHNKVAKCSIYLESWEANAKGGTGAIVGCEANSVSNVAVTSSSDPKHPVSLSSDPKHQSDVLDMFKKQFERARSGIK
jgi:hypothetical protein